MLKITKQKLDEIDLSSIQWNNKKKNVTVTEIELNVTDERCRVDRRIPKKYLSYFESRRKIKTQEPEHMLPQMLRHKYLPKEQRFHREQNKPTSKSKKNTMLLNQMIEILKTGENRKVVPLKQHLHKRRNIFTEESYQLNQFNQFLNRQSRTSKNSRPKVIQNEITRIGKLNNVVRRRLHSQEKCRTKVYQIDNNPSQNFMANQNKQRVELLTFYGNNNKSTNIVHSGKPATNQYQNRYVRSIEEESNSNKLMGKFCGYAND